MNLKGLDETDNLLISLLKKNARMSYSDLGEAVGLSRTAVKTRMTNLEEKGIIKGYEAVIDPIKNDGMTLFVVNIETRAENFEEATEKFRDAPETITLIQTTGNCHLLAICASENIETMRKFVNNIYKSIPGIKSINAHSILDVIKGNIIP
ncbi:MAG: Lrp/AsnC family transcriptional regulator [Clostridia bacterium]|nr:Lrp/AsnC family transcriptional regulator [Clostridia bacterium]